MVEDYMALYVLWHAHQLNQLYCNDEALKDVYVQGLPNSILQKVFAQVTLPKGLNVWKMVIQNLNQIAPRPYGDLEMKCLGFTMGSWNTTVFDPRVVWLQVVPVL